jgi:hypothetical protein
VYRLLLIDGHENHRLIEFQDFCKDKKIVTLCMPPHSSYLFQPLNVGCFSPLERVCYAEINSWARYSNKQVEKESECYQSLI